MNNKLSKTLIEHYNTCFLTLKGLINRFQNFWNLHIFRNLLHKPWHNDIKKIIKNFEKKIEEFKEYSRKYSPKSNPKSRWMQLLLSSLHSWIKVYGAIYCFLGKNYKLIS
jgi:hypothetical protein